MPTSTSSYSPEFKKKYLEAYRKHLCLANVTARELGVTARAVRNWRKENPDFDEELTALEEELADEVEGGLIKDAISPDGAPVSKIFYLKNNRREKYGDKQTIEMEPKKLWFDSPAEIAPTPEAPQLTDGQS